MSEESKAPETTPDADELELLRNQANMLGIKFHPNCGADTLKTKIAESLADGKASDPAPEPEKKETENQRRLRIKRHMMELVRVRITCMNPQKKEHQGELISAGNKVAAARRLVPFNVPWHVERCILNELKAKECTTFYTEKTSRGMSVRKAKTMKEFAIEELPSLTPEELKELAQRQAMANGTSEGR